jgi:hypothetical protein
MDAQSFAYWLNGFFELADPIDLDATQVQIIKDHLALVLPKVTPDRHEAANYVQTGSWGRDHWPIPPDGLDGYFQQGRADPSRITVC